MKASIPDFQSGSDYKMYYIAVLDPVPTPYCVFRRYKREPEMDLSSSYKMLASSYMVELYHDDSWALLDLQKRIRHLLETLPLTTVGGVFVQSLEVQDDFHMMPSLLQEVRTRVFQGVLDFEITHHPE
ncbi:hypothetical protein [Desulfosporosinus sp. FKA]|uniref:hypothetical protein n=1 Tax=Desulfosporosinus sp. FKA TaxID=1969834 RepID=UPI000B49AAA1|nr:hypothetical protein [Desulfosporosinus sp. FKA]